MLVDFGNQFAAGASLMHAFRRLLLGLLITTILAAPVLAVLNGWIGGQHWPMKHLQVSAPFHFVSQVRVQKVVMAQVRQGFFAVDLSAISHDLSRLHWVEHVQVRKKWPDTLIVQVLEYRPLAIWNGKQMLAEKGAVFAMPNATLPRLPSFTGQEMQVQEMLLFYQQAQPMFRSIGLVITDLSLNERRAWRVVLSNGLVLDIGRNDVGLRLARFIALLPKIRREDPRRLIHADLRYTNGFALVWQNTPQATAKAISPTTFQEHPVI
jgi:cell division protein FtsQ